MGAVLAWSCFVRQDKFYFQTQVITTRQVDLFVINRGDGDAMSYSSALREVMPTGSWMLMIDLIRLMKTSPLGRLDYLLDSKIMALVNSNFEHPTDAKKLFDLSKYFEFADD
jgi:hypothetical protein